ncbi:MAG: hypothetical protein K2X27_16125 [Candidatus Obscuribacterales bacterium]|nr:hypothetical protein [Candidatus Obscuribacterales bacterium]
MSSGGGNRTMNLEERAQNLEKEVENGHLDEVAKELHSLKPEERKAVKDLLVKHQEENADKHLPHLEFYDSGDIKSTDRKMDENINVHTEYDKKTGMKTTEDYDNRQDAVQSHFDYDTQTGQSTTAKYHYDSDNTTSFNAHDRQSNRNWSYDTDSQGRVSHTEQIDGKKRDFTYDENGLAQIDGHLGHWERKTDDAGKTHWINSEKGYDWEGRMNVDKDGNLHFQPTNGGKEFVFTAKGSMK